MPGAVRLLARGSWTSALTRWCDAQPGLVPFTGQCSLHRGQIMRLRGAYDEALAEFALAQRRYQTGGYAAPAGLALTEQGDVLRIRGKLDEAEAAYRQAAEFGHEPQPGLALSWLARGRTAAAISADPPAARRSAGAGAAVSVASRCRRDPGCGTTS